jgi:alkanesulfonate monooxygenase SsuD/methylene tetrahydromethanopterin reductase-like flavin-dependent oxidoreductase (luciferase family)
VLATATKPEELATLTKEVRTMAIAEGRDPYDIKFYQGMCPILGRTLEEAQAKHAKARENADCLGGLATISGLTGVDFAKFPLAEPFNFGGELGDNTVHTMVKEVEKALQQPNMTPRQLGITFPMCGFWFVTVGTPETVVDVIEDWINIGDADAMNFLCRLFKCSVLTTSY